MKRVNGSKTFGRTVAERRNALKLTLKALSQTVLNKDGRPVSMQYVHDIEQDRRMPSISVLKQLAHTLQIDEDELQGVGGIVPEAISEYLKAHPEQTRDLRKIFERAIAAGGLPPAVISAAR